MIYFNLNGDYSVVNSSTYSFKIKFLNLIIVAETLAKVLLEVIRNETMIDEIIIDLNEVLLKEISRLFVDSEHELHHILALNIHHHF